MKEIDETVNEQIIKFTEEVIEKLNCLLSELYKASEDIVDSEIMKKEEQSISDETEIKADAEVLEDKEHIVCNSDVEDIKPCDEPAFMCCSFTL